MRYRTYTLRIEASDDASITIDELDSLSAGIQHA